MLNIEEVKKTLSQNGYEYIQNIGSGAYSSILLCKNLKYNQLFAVKTVAKHQMSTREYDALISLNHPNIIKLFSTFNDKNSQYLVMEYCSKGPLSNKGKLDYPKFIFYAKQILEALAYCHSKQIAHRDIKPENILLDQYDYAKLADFGLSKSFCSNVTSSEKCGTLMYTAPETLQRNEISPFKADIWALGITFFVMVSGEPPFHFRTREELIEKVSLGNLDYSRVNMDKRIRYLISKMTEKDQELRPTAEKLLKLPIFSTDVNRRSSHIAMLFPNKSLIGNISAPIHEVRARTERSAINDFGSNNEKEKKPQISKIRSFRTSFCRFQSMMNYT